MGLLNAGALPYAAPHPVRLDLVPTVRRGALLLLLQAPHMSLPDRLDGVYISARCTNSRFSGMSLDQAVLQQSGPDPCYEAVWRQVSRVGRMRLYS